jgi:hypothetical protein
MLEEGTSTTSVEEMTRMMENLERINYECTEECHQTDAACDIEVQAEREELIEKLGYAINTTRIQYLFEDS